MIFKRSYKIPIYGARIYIVLCDSLEGADQELNLKLDTRGRELEGFDAVCLKIDWDHYMIFEYDPTPGIIAHECKHFINHVFVDNGVELDRYNDEHECYFLGWAVNRVHEVLNKYEKRK